MTEYRRRELDPGKDGWRRWLQPGASGAITRRLGYAVFLASLGLYATTLLPGGLPADSGEFQHVAATGGVAHPPGYPLYTMLGWLFSHAPLGPTPAWRVNLFSAVTAAAALSIVFLTASEITESTLGGLVAALSLGSATTFWATATKASIRPLTVFFAALCLYALVRHQSRNERQKPAANDRYLMLFSLALSLGLTHHPSLVFPGVVFTLYLVLIDPALLREPGRWLKAIVAALPGLLVLGYLPARGAPQLVTISGFLDHVLARGFRGDMFALDLLDRLVLLPTLLRFQFSGAVLVGMGLGALLVLWHDRKLALLLVGSFVAHMVVTLTYDAPQTVEYAMPAYVSLALLMAIPFKHLSGVPSRVSDRKPPTPDLRRAIGVFRHAVSFALLVVVVANLAGHYPDYRALSGSCDARDYAETLLLNAPEDALILSNWHWFTPLRYLQDVEGVRGDVTIDYVAPQGESLARTWVRSIEKYVTERPVIVVRFFEPEYGALPYSFEPLGEAYLVRSEPRTEMLSDAVPLDSLLGGQIEMLGYRLASRQIRPAQPLIVTLVWSPKTVPTDEIALFAQLIGPDGGLWSAAEDPRHSPDTLSPGKIVVDRFVVYPRLHASPGDYTLVIGAYSSDGRLQTSDGSDALVLETLHLRPSTKRPVTQHARRVRFAGGPTLIGVDYEVAVRGKVRTYLHWAGPGEATSLQLTGNGDAVVTEAYVPPLERGQYATVAVDRPGIPSHLVALGDVGARRWNLFFRGEVSLPSPNRGERYVPFGDAAVLTHAEGPADPLEPGAKVTLFLRFRAQRALQRDYIVSTSLTGLNADATWAFRVSHDTVPSLGAIPTLKWIRDSHVLDPHRLNVPIDAPAVPAVGSVLLYDHFTQTSLPHLDERLEPAVEVGTWQVAQ